MPASSSASVVVPALSSAAVRSLFTELTHVTGGILMDAIDAEVLLGNLAAQRAHVLGILEGLDEGQLRSPVLASGWSCLGMLGHLALDDERFWFQAVIAGRSPVFEELQARGSSWRFAEDATAERVMDLYREECRASDEVLAGIDLQASPGWDPGFPFNTLPIATVGQVVLHVITETACHAGHLDAARELLDGKQWLALD